MGETQVTRTRVTMTYTTPLDLRVKFMRAGLCDALKKVGAWHQRVLMPLHFTPTAYYKYKYALRAARYTKRKRRQFGHTNPLVFTGRMMNAALNGRPIIKNAGGLPRSRPTRSSIDPKDAHVGIGFSGLPRHTFFVPNPRYKGPDKVSELGRLTQMEGGMMARQLSADANEYWSKLKQPTTIP